MELLAKCNFKGRDRERGLHSFNFFLYHLTIEKIFWGVTPYGMWDLSFPARD